MLTPLLLFVVLFLIWRKLKNWQLDRIPTVPGYPIIGNLLDNLKPPGELFKQIRKNSLAYFPIYKQWGLQQEFIHIIHPEDIKMVLNSKHCIKRIYYTQEFIGLSIFTTKNQAVWQFKHKLISPLFNSQALKQYVTIFSKKSEEFVKFVANNQDEPLEVISLVTNYVWDCLKNVTLGDDVEFDGQTQIKNGRIIENLIIRRLTKPWLYPKIIYYNTNPGRKQKEITRQYHEAIAKVIEKEIEGDSTILATLLNSQNNGADITFDDIRNEIATFFFVGLDTTTYFFGFILMLLANHQEIQEKVVAELMDVLGDLEKIPTADDLQNLHYLHRCLKECLRLYPNASFIVRQPLKDFKTPTGYSIKKKSTLVLNFFDLHRNPRIFPNPNKFDPDRFLPENSKGRHPYAFLPFGAGSRNCIGQKFAMLVVKTGLCTILRKFKLEPGDSPDSIILVMKLSLATENGIKVKFLPRNYN